MSSTLALGQPQVGVGLQSYTFTIPSVGTVVPFGGSGIYNVKVEATMEDSVIGNGAGSGLNQQTAQVVTNSALSIVVNKNGSAVLTSSVPTPFQAAYQGKILINCVATDVITVVLSSANAIDKLLNSVQSIVSINQGI